MGADFEITVTSESDDRQSNSRVTAQSPTLNRDWKGYAAAAIAVAAATALSYIAETLFPVASLSLIYMTAVIAIATRFGLGSSIAASAMGFMAYDFLFTQPRFTFYISERGEFLILTLFLAASILTGNLAARLRARVNAGHAVMERMGKLYDFSRRVAAAASFDDVVWAAVSHVATTLQCESILLTPDNTGALQVVGGFPPEDRLEIRDMSAALWCWQKSEPAGRGSGTLPAARWFFLPVRTANGPLGVIGIAYDDNHSFAPTDRRLLEALVDQIALALARIHLGEDLEEARLASETERLRTALLSSVSHDLRTPLVSIIGAAGSLAEPSKGLTEPGRTALAETILEEGERLDRYVQNLLDMTRLGHGALKPNLAATDLADLIGSARHRLRGLLRDHRVQVDLPDTLPPLKADPILTEQVIVNILDNAVKYAAPGTTIRITALLDGQSAVLSIADEGPGIPAGSIDRVFDMFYRANSGDAQRAGTGLGLAICKGLIEAQGGRIRAEASQPTGTRIIITLPTAQP